MATYVSDRRQTIVESDLTLQHAISTAMRSKTEFALSLSRQFLNAGSLSSEQVYWVHRLAQEFLAKKRTSAWMVSSEEAEAQTDPPNIPGAGFLELLREGQASGLRNPRITGRGFVVKLHRTTSTLQLVIYRDDRNRYFQGSVNIINGRIGRHWFDERGSAWAYVNDLLQLNAEEARALLAEQGQLSGQCCYCNRPLTHGRSTQAGYGPVCARRYGLDW